MIFAPVYRNGGFLLKKINANFNIKHVNFNIYRYDIFFCDIMKMPKKIGKGEDCFEDIQYAGYFCVSNNNIRC